MNHDLFDLTPREREILILIGHGHSTKTIAARLGIAVKTVSTHMWNLYPKIGAHTPTQAMLFALRTGLVRLEDVSL